MIEHFMGAGINCLDMIDVFADAVFLVDSGFIVISRNDCVLDVPVELAGEPPSTTTLLPQSALRLALVAWKQADADVKYAFVQGRALTGRPLYAALSLATRVFHEVPYVCSIALRALRPDIQQFVAAASFELVLRAPHHDRINDFFEACFERPIKFTQHSVAWKNASEAFVNLGCSGTVCDNAKRATLQLDNAFIKTTRRDLILLVLTLIMCYPHNERVESNLHEIVSKFPWLLSQKAMEMPWWCQ